MCHHAGHLQPWALFMVLFRVHCSLGRSQNTCTAGQSSLFTESASEARSLIFHSCPPGCLWWPYKGKIPFRQRRAAQKKRTHWQSVRFLTSSFSKRKPPVFHFFSGYFFVPSHGYLTQPFLELLWHKVFLYDWKESKVISENLSL